MRSLFIAIVTIIAVTSIQMACAPTNGKNGQSTQIAKVAKKTDPGATSTGTNTDQKMNGCEVKIEAEGKKTKAKKLTDQELQALEERLIVVKTEQELKHSAGFRATFASDSDVAKTGKLTQMAPVLICKEFNSYKGDSFVMDGLSKPAQIMKGAAEAIFTPKAEFKRTQKLDDAIDMVLSAPPQNDPNTATTVADPGAPAEQKTADCPSKEVYALANNTIEIVTCEIHKEQDGATTQLKTRAIYGKQKAK